MTSPPELLGISRGSPEDQERGTPRDPEGLRGTGFLVAVVLFFLVRLLLLVVRDPFFDELFTVWMAGKPFGEILPALQLDSGPPLYYLIARIPSVIGLRVLSLVFATVTFALVLRRSLVAAALLAVYPPAVLFAVEARAYALCGLLIAVAALAFLERKPWLSAVAVLLAAYSHWYGAFFFPLLLLGRPRFQALLSAAVVAMLFLPGLFLAMEQPPASMAWLGEKETLDALGALSLVRTYPTGLFASVPFALSVAAGALTVLTLAGALMFRAAQRDHPEASSWRIAPWVLLPILLAVGFAAAGRPVYFAMRLESVIAVPLMLSLAHSLGRWPRKAALGLGLALGVCGLAATLHGAIDHARRPLDSHREAATILRKNVRPQERVVATGYVYLQAMHELGEKRVRAYPLEQGRHPGWRVTHQTREPLPPGSFVWAVERAAPELAALRREGRRARLLFENDRSVILRVE